ncbi:MAG: GTP-binding protein [Promethearchaeia archaeon]
MIKISMTIVDTGGQERFKEIKKDFFKGTAAAAIVFDLSRPETFKKVDTYHKELRKITDNIPIVLVGNKSDLKESIGETVSREEILKKVNNFNLFEYIETSALENNNVDVLFNRLAVMCLFDLRPRLGEIRGEGHFTFKVLLAGPAAVGKSTLIKTFIDDDFSENYQLTIGVDFKSHDFKIMREELPEEVRTIIIEAVEAYGGKFKTPIVKRPPSSQKASLAERSKVKDQEKEKPKEKTPQKASKIEKQPEIEVEPEKKKILTNNWIYFMVIVVLAVVFGTLLTHFVF